MADKKQDLREGLEKLKQLSVDELSDEELEEVAGGVEEECSNWCCSDGTSDPTDTTTIA